MASASQSDQSDQNNFKIAELFDEHCYETWRDYVLGCQERGESIDSRRVETLALLCVLCYKFTKDGKNYEKLFFDLLCQALESDSDSIYRSKHPTKVRPKLFKHPPKQSVQRSFSHVWPIAFNVCENDEDIRDTFYVGIPSQYLHASAGDAEEAGALSAVLYLVMSDTVGSFRKSLQGTEMTQVDCPCLLDYFRRSSLNNMNQLPALIGEYLALLKACFGLGFHEEWRFQCEEMSNDFRVHCKIEARKFSVKTDNRNGRLRYFVREDIDISTAPKEHNNRHNTILILNCDCFGCKLNPIMTLAETGQCNETCSRVRATDIIPELFGSDDRGTHYVTSAGNFFDLRFAMSAFNHDAFRRGDEQQRSGTQGQERFRSRREFIACFERMAASNGLSDVCLVFSSE